jgi:alpha-galactosidase
VISVDQDSLGSQGYLVWSDGPELQVWARPLAGGARAVALLNRSAAPAKITAYLSRVGLHVDSASVRDLWTHQELGKVRGQFAATVPSHGVVMVRMTAVR